MRPRRFLCIRTANTAWWTKLTKIFLIKHSQSLKTYYLSLRNLTLARPVPLNSSIICKNKTKKKQKWDRIKYICITRAHFHWNLVYCFCFKWQNWLNNCSKCLNCDRLCGRKRKNTVQCKSGRGGGWFQIINGPWDFFHLSYLCVSTPNIHAVFYLLWYWHGEIYLNFIFVLKWH